MRDTSRITGVVLTSKVDQSSAQACEGISEDQQKNSDGVLHQMMLDSIACSGTARGHLELAVDRGQVPVDGARTDDELFSHLDIGQPLCYQAQHIDLTGGQASRIGG